MLVKILKYDIVRDVATRGGEVAPSPEMPPPVALAQVRELHLHPMRRPSLDAPHEVADRNMRRDFHEHMDMFSRQNAGYDLDAQFSAHLPDNRSYPLPQRAFQHLVAILRDPDDVIPMVKNRVTPSNPKN